MSPPAVSVIVPAYQAEHTLRATMDSLRGQSLTDWEAVIVDDGSTDGTAALLRDLAASEPRISAISQSNSGASAARNAGIAAASSDWLLFLDADDRIVDGGLAALVAAANEPGVTWTHGGWFRSFDGEADDVQTAAEIRDPVDRLTRGCPFAIHACLVQRAAVVTAGGFNATLTACEDWDLWRRLAMAGHRPVAVGATVAEYVVRSASASFDTERMLADGLTVIETGYREASFSDAEYHQDRAAFAAYVAGLALGRGEDVDWLIQAAGLTAAADVGPDVIADRLFAAIPVGARLTARHWPGDEGVAERVSGWLQQLELAVQANDLRARTLRRLEQSVAATVTRHHAPKRFGESLLLDVDLEDSPYGSLAVPSGLQRVHLRGWLAGALVATAEIVPLAEEVDGVVILDALLEKNAWAVAEQMVLCPLLKSLTVSPAGTISRGRVVLGELGGAEPTERGLLDAAGWNLFMQEAFGDRTSEPSAFYENVEMRRTRYREVDGDAAVDITDGPIALRSTATSVRIEVTISGEPLDTLVLAPTAGRISAGRLRRQIALRNSVQLVHVAMRSWLARPAAQRSASTRSSFGNGAPTGDDRPFVARASFSAGAPPLPSRQRLHAAPAGLVDQASDGAGVLVPDAQPRADGQVRRNAGAFESLFTSGEDPWKYTSGYETVKYEQTLSLVPEGCSKILELACAEGHFTEMLAPAVDDVVASDISSVALERAAKRCEAFDNVTFFKHDLFREPIEGRWDAIVCSEVLYYAGDADALRPIVRRMLDALNVGGVLMTAHANVVVDDPDAPGFDWAEAYGALGIQRALLSTGIATLEEEIVTPMYRVQRYRRRSRLGARLPHRTTRTLGEVSPDIPDDVRARFLPNGGTPERESTSGGRVPLTVPILMYHRVAPTGSDGLRRYRVTPAEFHEQLRFLSKAGYQSISTGQWRDALTLGRELPDQPIMLTFDDGYQDFAEHAAPALRQHGFGATVMLVSELVGTTNRWDADREVVPLMGWDTVRDLQRDGFEFGAHTRTHPPLTACSPDEMYAQMRASIVTVGEELGVAPVAFAYPFGDVTDGVRAVAGLAGVELGLTCEDRVALEKDDLLLLPRVEIRGDGDPVKHLIHCVGDW